MDRSTRIAVPALIVATVVCGVLAALLRSELLAVATAILATLVVVVGLSTVTRAQRHTQPGGVTRFSASTSTTVDMMELSRSGAVPSPVPPGMLLQGAPAAAGALDRVTDSRPECADIVPFTPKLPPGSEPREVVAALLVASRAAGRPLCAHLWLDDQATATLRLVEAVGRYTPEPVPVSTKDGLLGNSISDGHAHLGIIRPADEQAIGEQRWRYVLPLAGSDLQGVAAVDFAGNPPNMEVLTTVSATLRASLSGALALHVARSEAEIARVLVETCASLARVLDPNDVLHAALESAMGLAEAETGSIMILDPETRRMRIAIARGLPEDIVTQTDISEGDGIAGWVVASRQPLVIEDLKDRGIRSRRHGVRSAVCVPLADDDGVIGVLNVGSTTFHARISRTTLHTLEALGRTIVVALRNAWASGEGQDLYFDTLKALALALEARDPYSHGGTERVIELAEALAEYFGMAPEDTKALRVAAMLHDVGMVAAGTNASSAEGPLTTVEWGMLKMHPVIAAEILAEAPTLSNVIPIVYHHHEHYDGSGYVAGLAGAEIPLGARILSVVDAYVSMTSGRPYRLALTHADAVSELRREAGRQFDPSIVQAVIDVVGVSDGAGLLGGLTRTVVSPEKHESRPGWRPSGTAEVTRN